LGGIAALFERGLSGDGEAQEDHEKHQPEPEPSETPEQIAIRQAEEQLTARRQALSREFGPAVQNEQEAELERGRTRERRGE
jgi:hypothetical protein